MSNLAKIVLDEAAQLIAASVIVGITAKTGILPSELYLAGINAKNAIEEIMSDPSKYFGNHPGKQMPGQYYYKRNMPN
ncbi:TPA: hypothetical protein HA239_06410 [Candidatus Woesearchaeota archaeon]|nr:hypothetical protein QT06_C0001G0879 [archaeon GW2011_AR15]MBS3103342.1 hypothetical protein [Candidatus Woesearchaeota archaeon]HIH42008.1 hypothetical protein [Candidatus Woesearchaeota archaeon]